MTRKNLFTFGSAVLTALFATSVMADQANTGAGDFFNNSPESVKPAFHDAPKQSELPALNYVNQPPMVPHSVKNYQITKNVNQCLNRYCHHDRRSALG